MTQQNAPAEFAPQVSPYLNLTIEEQVVNLRQRNEALYAMMEAEKARHPKRSDLWLDMADEYDRRCDLIAYLERQIALSRGPALTSRDVANTET